MEGGSANAGRPSRLIKPIKHLLKQLVGLPFSDTRGAANLQIFEFGVQKPALNNKGEEVTFGDFFLTVTCSWEFRGPQGIIAQSADYELPPLPVCILSTDFHFQRPFDNLKSQLIYYWWRAVEDDLPVVKNVEVLSVDRQTINMTRGMSLSLFLQEEEDSWDDWALRKRISKRSATVQLGQLLRFYRP